MFFSYIEIWNEFKVRNQYANFVDDNRIKCSQHFKKALPNTIKNTSIKVAPKRYPPMVPIKISTFVIISS